jgi:hypothetical protein
MQTSTLTRQILCTTVPTDPRDREDLWKARKRQAGIGEAVKDNVSFSQRHPATAPLSGLRRVCAFFLQLVRP